MYYQFNLTQLLPKPRLVSVLGLLAIILVSLTGCQSFQKPKQGDKGWFGKNDGRKKTSPSTDDALDPLGARNINRLVIHDLTPTQIGTTMRAKFAKGNNEQAALGFYEDGQQYYKKGLQLREQNPDGKEHVKAFEDAAKQFRLAGSNWQDSGLEQDALFYEAESLFFANRYVQANRTYEKLIGEYPSTRYLDMAQARRFAMSQYWLALDRDYKKSIVRVPYPQASRPTMGVASEARRVLNRIRLDDPTGKMADDATMALGNAFFEAAMYQDAAEAYEDLRRNYPGSRHMFKAHVLELKALMNSYHGESYHDEPLVRADKLLRQIVRQFPNEIESERPYLEKEAAAIRNLMANRDYTLAQYYERRGENRAASIMYEQVARDYGNSAIGIEVDERLAALDGKDPYPTQYAQWLVDIFPKSEASRPLIAAGSRDSITR